MGRRSRRGGWAGLESEGQEEVAVRVGHPDSGTRCRTSHGRDSGHDGGDPARAEEPRASDGSLGEDEDAHQEPQPAVWPRPRRPATGAPATSARSVAKRARRRRAGRGPRRSPWRARRTPATGRAARRPAEQRAVELVAGEQVEAHRGEQAGQVGDQQQGGAARAPERGVGDAGRARVEGEEAEAAAARPGVAQLGDGAVPARVPAEEPLWERPGGSCAELMARWLRS